MRTIATDAVIGVVGAGTMGGGIAEVAARSGHQVLLMDVSTFAAQRALDEIAGRLDKDVARKRLTQAEADAITGRLQAAPAVDDLAGCALVVEAVAEELQVKRDLMSGLEKVLDDDAVLATNTSSLSVTAVAGGLRLPGRVVGLHFFNPAPRMRLVEVVRGDATEAGTVATVSELMTRWGKQPVPCLSTPGFIVNRVARPFYGEAQRIVEERLADAATIDLLLREAGGFPMGPFELTDLVGQDVNLAVSRSVWDQTFHDQRYAPTVLQQRLVDAGRYGRKSRRGMYRYDVPEGDPEGPRPQLQVAARRLPPNRVRYTQGWSIMEPLLERITAGGVEVADVGDTDAACTDEIGLLLPSGGRLLETAGEPAGHLGEEVVVLDWALDAESTTRVAVAASPHCSAQTLSEAIGVLQAAGVEVTIVGDGPGLVVARTVAMIINEAVDLVARGEAQGADVDTAMTLGTGYPMGPVQWGEAVGPACVVGILAGLHDCMPTGRYRISPALRLAADTGAPLGA